MNIPEFYISRLLRFNILFWGKVKNLEFQIFKRKSTEFQQTDSEYPFTYNPL